MKLAGKNTYINRESDAAIFNKLDLAVQKPRIVTFLSESGTGKTATLEHWWHGRSQIVRPNEVIHIFLSTITSEYRSSIHMIFARILDQILQEFSPSYAPTRSYKDNEKWGDRFGKKELEALRKKVQRALRERAIRIIIIDNIQYITMDAVFTAFSHLGCDGSDQSMCRSLILAGQKKKYRQNENILPTWLNNSFQRTNEFYLDAIELSYLSEEELLKFSRILRDDALNATVPNDANESQVKRQMGSLIEATKGNWSKLARLMHLLDEEMDSQPDNQVRHITIEVVERVKNRLQSLKG